MEATSPNEEEPCGPAHGPGQLTFAEVHLAAIVESSDDAIISKDLNGIITSWNRGAEAIFGYSAEEAVGKPISMLAAPDHANEMPQILERLRRGERIDHYETYRRRKDGSIINVSLTVSPMRNSAGEITGASKIARDITVRRATEEKLALREQELRTLLASLPDIVSRFDSKFKFCYISPAVERATGTPPSQYLGKTHAEAGVPAVLAARLEEELRKIFETGQENKIEFEMPRPDGEVRHYYGIGIPEFAADGHVSTVLTIVRDTTDKKRAEQTQQAIERELLLLVEASSALMATPHSAEVAQTLIGIAQQFGAADAHAVWRKQASTGTWRLVSSSGLSAQFVAEGTMSSESAAQSISEPVEIEDVQNSSLLWKRKDQLKAEGIQSMLVVPLAIHSEFSGTVVFYWKGRHEFSSREVRIAKALGNLAAAAFGAAELYERQTESRERAEWAERRSTFLAEAGALLSSSLDYETTLANVAKLAVPGFADWCSVDILDEKGHVQRVAVQHSDAEKIRFAYEFAHKYPPREEDVSRIALRTGKSLLMEDVPDELLVAAAKDAEHLRLMRMLGLRSLIIAPMVVGTESLGTLTFINAESGRRYKPADLQIAEELARRAGTAIAHARLYQDVRASLAREQSARRKAELLNSVGPTLLSELDPERLAQNITHIATTLVGGQFGALFYNMGNKLGESSASRSFSGNAPQSIRTALPSLHNKAILLEDATKDTAHQHTLAFAGAADETPIRSYLAVPVRTRSGQVSGVLVFGHQQAGVFTDQHEQIATGLAAQAAIALDNARLFDDAREIQGALRRSNEELRRVNEDLNQFAYSASHDLQEPLRMVAIYSQLLQRKYGESLDSKAHEYIRFTTQGAMRMEMLVKDLLAFTQAADLGDEAVPVVNASAVLERALENLQTTIEENQAGISGCSLPFLQVKEVHLLQLFQNLIGNAIKYRKPDLAPEVKISCEEQEGWCKICISDNGIGIPPAYSKQVFGIFKRLHTGDKYSGTGIGLAICQRIVERYGGRIWVESEESKGSSFCFTLPRGSLGNETN